MNTVAEQLLIEIAGPVEFPSPRHKLALGLACEQWGYELAEQPGAGRDSLKSRVKQAYARQMYNDGYSLIAVWLAIVVAAAAIEWAIKRFLDWLYPQSAAIDICRANRLLKCQQLGFAPEF